MDSSFIADLARKVLEENSGDPGKTVIIFPNRRAGIFFRNELGGLIDKPTWMPEVYSLEDFILEYSPLSKVDTLEAVFLLYETYKKHQKKPETFDKFFFWGEMIIRDFEEIDQYRVNADQLFTSIKTQKELDEEFFFLDEIDKQIIQTFWSTFLPEASKSQQAFLETWKLLKPIYHDFKEQLLNDKKGYGGLIYRHFSDHIEEISFKKDTSYYFAGFNALTFCEEFIIKFFIREYKAEMVWDVDKYYLSNTHQEAGLFIRQYAKDTLLGRSLKDKIPERITLPRVFHLTGVSLEVGQAKAMAEDLKKISSKPGFRPERTVVVLPHEYMLMPVLESLPDEVNNVNITMGYPLKDTSVFSLLDSVLFLQETRRESITAGISYYHKPVLEILEHPLMFSKNEVTLSQVIGDIRKRNLIFIYRDDFPVFSDVLEFIFSKPSKSIDYLLNILQKLYHKWNDSGSGLELEFISRFHNYLESLSDLLGEKGDNLDYSFLRKLLKRLAGSLKIPFTGEPLNGLQVMGILETRNLDFDHVFVLNMNEDSWPAPPKRGSFIPFNIRKAFQLPTHEHQDAIYSYLFYRLMQRAKSVHFYHNTVSEFNINGEISRLVRQLEFETGHKIEKRILSNPIKITPPKKITIEKNPQILEKLNKYRVKERGKYSRLSPSALDTYLTCRLKFYFKYVQELFEPDDMQEEMEPMVFGNILHNSMETLFKQYTEKNKRKIIDENDFFGLKAGIRGAINKAFINHYDVKKTEKFELEGRNLIAADIIEKTINKILSFDQKYAPFRVLGLEAGSRDGFKIDYPLEVNGRSFTIGLKGNIDRLDMKDGVIRVIDYKTGKDDKNFDSVDSFIERENKNRNKAAFQLFFYCYLVFKNYQEEYQRIEPGLYNSRDLFSEDFNWQIVEKKVGPVTDFRQYVHQFESVLHQLLSELWDPEVPFDQVEDFEKCKSCPYKGICNRD